MRAAPEGSPGSSKRALEADLQDERYRLLGRAIKDPIWDWDIRTDRVERNATFLEVFRYAPEQTAPTGVWWVGRVLPEDRDRIARALEGSSTGTPTPGRRSTASTAATAPSLACSIAARCSGTREARRFAWSAPRST